MKNKQISLIVATTLFAAAAIQQGIAAEQSLPLPVRTVQVAPTTLGQPATFGQWSDVMPWPVIAVHANLMPNGKVIAWDATPDDFDDDPHTTDIYTTRVTVWDPQTNLHIQANNDTNADLFCAGSSHLWDGRILFAGGDSGIAGLNGPLSNTSIYDPETNTWEQMPDMAAPRWYSSNAALPSGETLTYAGRYGPSPVAEVFQHNETWRSLALPNPAGLSINYQWMQATADGTVMTFGPQNTISKIDTSGSGQITTGPTRDQYPLRRYGSYAMYDTDKVLVTGGTEEDGGPFSYDSSVIINTGTQQTTDTSAMNFARTQHNLTILADGSVLATGGNTSGAELIDLNTGVLTPEIWSPDTGQWQTMNDMQIDRQYHSVALLLPDGTVLSAGGGYCGTCYEEGYEERNAEIFSPPYLFSTGSTPAIRPKISLAPKFIDYNRSFIVATNKAASIEKIHLIKLGSVTHSTNQEQRLIPLEFSRAGNSLQVRAPTTRNIAPPGHYMLFIVDDQGVPSESAMILVGQPLIESGQDVVHTAKPGKTDQYAIQADGPDAALLVTVQGHTTNTTLKVNGQAANGTATAECNTTANAGQVLECRLSNQTETRWLIEVSASENSTYRLNSSLSTTPDPQAIQPVANNIIRTGGGGGISISIIGLLFLRRKHTV